MTAPLDLDLDLELELGDDWERSEPVLEALLERFGEWMRAGGRSGAEWPVAEALRFKADYLDGRLGCWRRGDLAEILTELFPRKVSADEANVALVAPTLRAFFTWLDEAGLLHADSDPVAGLHAELDRIEPGLAGLMFDESRYGPGKTVTTAMLADGVDLDDPDAVQAWIDASNARLGEQRPRPAPPPVALPDDDVLAELAAAAPMMTHLRTVVDWVGDGRLLTRAGDLRARDAVALALLLDREGRTDRAARAAARLEVVWALAAQLLAVEGGRRLVRGPAAAALWDAPLDAWKQVLLALVARGGASLDAVEGTAACPDCAAGVVEGFGSLLVALHVRGPMSTEELASFAREDLVASGDLAGPQEHGRAPDTLSAAVGALAHWLAELWVVEVTGSQVRLATLGRWFVCALLEHGGVEVPVVPDLSEADPATLLATCADWRPGEADAAVDGWIASRGVGIAAEQLAALASTGNAGERARAFAALGRVGTAAEPVVRCLRAVPARRAEATAWLVAQGLEEPERLDVAGPPEALAAQLAGLVAQAGPEQAFERFSAAVPAVEQPCVLEGLWRVADAGVLAFLRLAAERAPKPAAKAARRALFRQRTASGR